MQNKYWHKHPHHSRENSWAHWNGRQDRSSPSYTEDWYNSYPEDADVNRRNSYRSSYFSNGHLPDNTEKYPEYFSSPELPDLSSRRISKAPLIPHVNVHSFPGRRSVSPNASHFESLSRISSPRPYGALSPHSHLVDVVSPNQYHSEVGSPRQNHSATSPIHQHFNISPRYSSVELPSSKRMLLNMDVVNSSPEAKFYSKNHPRESSVNSQTALLSSPPRINTCHGSSEYNNNRYSERRGGWFSGKKHYRPSMYYDRNNSSNKTYRSKSSKASSETSSGQDHQYKSSNFCSKVNSSAKLTPSAPPVEKSITNLLSKLFTENSNEQSTTLNIQHPEKSSKSQIENTSFIDESKAKSMLSSSLPSKKKKDLNSARVNVILDNGLQLHDRNKHAENALQNGCSHSYSETEESTHEIVEKDIALKKKSNTKSDFKSPPLVKPLSITVPGEITFLDSELKGRKSKLGKSDAKCITEDSDRKSKLLPSHTNQNKVKLFVSTNDKFSDNNSISLPFNLRNSPSQKMPSSNKEDTKDMKINGDFCFNSHSSILSYNTTASKNVNSVSNSNKLSCNQQMNEKSASNSDIEAELLVDFPKTLSCRARKSFPRKARYVERHSTTTEIFKSPPKVSSKKQKKRYFRGGKYDLSINGQIKKKKKKSTENKLSVSNNDDSSETSEMSYKNNNNLQISESMAVNVQYPSGTPVTDDMRFPQLSPNYEKVSNVHSVLKLPLKDVLWSKLGKSQNSFAQGNGNYTEFTNALYNNSSTCRKTASINTSKDYAGKTNPAENMGVARKTHSSSRMGSRYLEKGDHISFVEPVQHIQRDNCDLEYSDTETMGKPDNLNSNSESELNSQTYHYNKTSDMKSIRQNEHFEDEKTFCEINSGGQADESQKPGSGDESYVAETSSSSDTDDEVSLKNRKKGEMKTQDCSSQVDDACDGINSSDTCDIGIEALCSEDYKGSMSHCTCLTKSLCDAGLNMEDGQVLCQAVDTIDTELVSCTNELTKSNLVRPSVKIPCIAMCDIHLWRLQHHQCCPNCGFFCTQGSFLQCVSVDPKTKEHQFHFFHHHCENFTSNEGIALCPHCGIKSENKTVKLKLSVPYSPISSNELDHDEVQYDQIEQETSDLYNHSVAYRDLSEREINLLSKDNLFSCIPDKLQMESMLKSIDTEKAFNLRPSGKSFYGPVKTGDVDKVLHLLAMGVDPNHKFEHHNNDTPLHVAAAAGYPILVHILVQAGACVDILSNSLYTPLMLAVEKNHLSIVQYLLMSGAQQDLRSDEGMTCLHLATSGGNLEICKIFLDREKTRVNNQDDGGWTPLVWAAEHKHLDVVKLLLERGADASIRDNEENIALHWAAYSGNAEIAMLLLEAGCSLHAVNEHGDSPLHIAAREDNYECVVLFIARGAIANLQNNDNKTPAMCCQNRLSETWMALSMSAELRKWKENETRKNELVIHRDISRGKEDYPIQVVNGVDNEQVPTDFLYIMENCETSQVNIDTNVLSLQSCKCDGDCSSKNCACSIMSFRCWYDKTGCLLPQFNMTDPPMIFECNRTCLCWKSCINRVVQHGITCRLQMFRTRNKGWGVRTLKGIPKGTFICEYVGEIISDLEADNRDDDSYLFDLDNRDTDIFCLDARYYGNISRFINHQCDPNLVPVKVFIDHQDLKFPRIAFFSARDIDANEELGFDYGEKFWIIKYKWFLCGCGSLSCKYSKNTIDDTLKKYHIRLQNEQDFIS